MVFFSPPFSWRLCSFWENFDFTYNLLKLSATCFLIWSISAANLFHDFLWSSSVSASCFMCIVWYCVHAEILPQTLLGNLLLIFSFFSTVSKSVAMEKGYGINIFKALVYCLVFLPHILIWWPNDTLPLFSFQFQWSSHSFALLGNSFVSNIFAREKNCHKTDKFFMLLCYSPLLIFLLPLHIFPHHQCITQGQVRLPVFLLMYSNQLQFQPVSIFFSITFLSIVKCFFMLK